MLLGSNMPIVPPTQVHKWLRGCALLAAVAFNLVGCSGSSRSVATTPTSQKVDACMIGRWVVTSQSFTDTTSVPGVTLVGTGGVGEVDTFAANGQEVNDYTNASPYIESGSGHSYTYTARG